MWYASVLDADPYEVGAYNRNCGGFVNAVMSAQPPPDSSAVMNLTDLTNDGMAMS